MKRDCVFCRIGRGEIPAYRVHEDALTLAFMDVDQVTPGHVFVVIRPHLETTVDLNPDQAAAVFRAVHHVARAATAAHVHPHGEVGGLRSAGGLLDRKSRPAGCSPRLYT